MLEGGNHQLQNFFDRHRLTQSLNHRAVEQNRYRTKAARFYREHLVMHVKGIASAKQVYEGREASRKGYSKPIVQKEAIGVQSVHVPW